MMQHNRPPTPTDLVEFPQLAVLELLQTALGQTCAALMAAHPELASYEPMDHSLEVDWLVAEHLLIVAGALERLVKSYRQTLQITYGSRPAAPPADTAF